MDNKRTDKYLNSHPKLILQHVLYATWSSFDHEKINNPRFTRDNINHWTQFLKLQQFLDLTGCLCLDSENLKQTPQLKYQRVESQSSVTMYLKVIIIMIIGFSWCSKSSYGQDNTKQRYPHNSSTIKSGVPESKMKRSFVPPGIILAAHVGCTVSNESLTAKICSYSMTVHYVHQFHLIDHTRVNRNCLLPCCTMEPDMYWLLQAAAVLYSGGLSAREE